MLFFKLIGGIFAKVGIGLSLLFSPAPTILTPAFPTPLVLAPDHAKTKTDAPEAQVQEVPAPAHEPKPEIPKLTLPNPALIPAPKPVPQEPAVQAPMPGVQEPEPPAALPPGANLNDIARAALVNVLCTTKAGGLLKPISGSGVIVDDRGIVLTNAHVAQFFLLRDYPVKNNVECALRTGSPARPLYTATILYFPPAWMAANVHKITQQVPTGTGEHDYAFLLITGRTDPAAALPASFSSVPLSAREPDAGETVLLAGYPAGFLEGQTVQMNLFITTATTLISDVFTFHQGGGADLMSIGGTILSQHGSSGGAVVAARDASLIGTIVTSTTDGTTADRDLRSITVRHMNESYRAQTGESLEELFEGDVVQKAAAFNIMTVPSLSRALTAELEK